MAKQLNNWWLRADTQDLVMGQLTADTQWRARGQRVGASVALILAAASISCSGNGGRVPAAGAPAAGAQLPAVVVGARIGAAASAGDAGAPGEWLMPAKDFAGSRYSALTQITADNAARLHVAWTFSTGVLRGHEGGPLVAGSTMYVVTPYPNVAYALDLARPGAPLRWKYRPENAQAAIGEACCDVVNRGAAYVHFLVTYIVAKDVNKRTDQAAPRCAAALGLM